MVVLPYGSSLRCSRIMFTMTLADAFCYVGRVLHQVCPANQEAMIHIRLAGVMFDVLCLRFSKNVRVAIWVILEVFPHYVHNDARGRILFCWARVTPSSFGEPRSDDSYQVSGCHV